MKRYLRGYPLSIIVLTSIIILSFSNLSSSGIHTFKGFDKLAHFFMYALASALLWAEFFLKHRHIQKLPFAYAIAGAVVAPIIFGGIIEIAQASLTNNRAGELLDFICNCLGVSAGTLFALIVLKRIIRR
jgi:VanZ family protein